MEKSLNWEKLNSDDPKVKYAYTKELLQISEEAPEQLYPCFEEVLKLVGDPNNVIKWTAIDIIGFLSVADKENKINTDVMQTLITLLHDSKLITCNHAIFALGLIAQNKPEYKESIIKELLSTRDNDFETDDCEAIATGKVLEALLPFVDEIKSDKKVIDFVKVATGSSRNSTQKKATEFLKLLK